MLSLKVAPFPRSPLHIYTQFITNIHGNETTTIDHIINGIKWSASLLISIFGCVQNKFRNKPYVTCPV
jgi:hypothetical protein